MDDQFLRDLKKQPNPEFAARLRATLRTLPPNAVARVAPAADFKRWFAAAASIAVVGFAFTLPPVQAAAEAFLDLFRVRQFTGVAVRPGAAPQLGVERLDPEAIFGTVEPLTPPQEPVSYATAADAGAAAGIRVRTPAWVPHGYSSTGFMASSEHGGAYHDQHCRSSGAARHARARRRRAARKVSTVKPRPCVVPPIVTQTFVNRTS